VQVNPIKPTLKAPGTEHLTLEYDELLHWNTINCFKLWFQNSTCAATLRDHTTTDHAALSGHFAVFMFALHEGCPLSMRVVIEASLGGSLPLAFENQQGHIFVALLTPRTARGDLPPKSAVQPAAVPVWQVI